MLALITSIIKKSGYHLTYSATPSMPKGFYLILPIKKITRYDIVEFTPPSNVLDFIKKKRWVPQSGLVIKQVFAIPNDHVCIRNQAIWINGNKVGKVYKFYDKNKLLPQTKICGKLEADQYLLLSTKNERSFDGRYFGAVSSKRISGKAIPLIIFG